MPEDNRIDDVEKFLADQKSFEDRAIKVFDEKLAKLGWHGPDGSGKPGKSHHKAPARPPAETPRNRRLLTTICSMGFNWFSPSFAGECPAHYGRLFRNDG